MKHWITLCILFILLIPKTGSAATQYEVSVKVIDQSTAELRITYPVSPGTQSIAALPTKKLGDFIDGHRELVSAYANDGTDRIISNNTAGQDAQIEVKSGDKDVTLLYKLTNTLGSNNVSLYNFLLFFGSSYPSGANLTISAPEGFKIISPTLTSIQSNQGANTLSAKNLHILVHPKPNSSYTHSTVGNFSVTGPSSKVSDIKKVLSNISFAPEFFRKTLGLSLPNKTHIIIVSVPEQAAYEASGLVLSPDIILIDPNELGFGAGPNDPEKVILHELGHLALSNANIFQGDMYSARWFDEGIAVFSEQFATDNYLIRDEASRSTDTALTSFKKMTRKELELSYSQNFDYDFLINSNVQPIDRTYAHAGLIMYNLHLQNPSHLPNIIRSLKTIPPKFTCGRCDTNSVLAVIQKQTGLSKENILYPYKNDMNNGNLDKLLLKEVDAATQQKIKQDSAKSIGNYVNNDTPTIISTKTSENDASDKQNGNSSTDTGVTKTEQPDEVQITTDGLDTASETLKTKPSIFKRIKTWIMNLF